MQLWRRIGRQSWAKTTIGVMAAEYLRLVGKTTRLVLEPPDIYDRLAATTPVILALWHGQHLLAPMVRRNDLRFKVLVSRHHDGEINAIAAGRLGVGAIRGSGSHGGSFVHKGGAAAFQAMVSALDDGCSIALTADVPKVSRVVGPGIVKLAQLSGRPVYPAAVATRHRIVLDNWDRTAINLPFGRGAAIAADPLSVPFDAGPAELETARGLIEERLNAATRRAYEIIDKPRRGA